MGFISRWQAHKQHKHEITQWVLRKQTEGLPICDGKPRTPPTTTPTRNETFEQTKQRQRLDAAARGKAFREQAPPAARKRDNRNER